MCAKKHTDKLQSMSSDQSKSLQTIYDIVKDGVREGNNPGKDENVIILEWSPKGVSTFSKFHLTWRKFFTVLIILAIVITALVNFLAPYIPQIAEILGKFP